mmetsp:Transcript_9540/g.15597  ORF Transcript_9540/g.15597 Transcript_9540/m.15597 type:complete len:574 (-) Transcript_9540:94-1815(-)
MRGLAILNACLACTVHGRRVQTVLQPLASSEAQDPLLLALNPAIGGSPAVQSSKSMPHIDNALSQDHFATYSKISQTPNDTQGSSVGTPPMLLLQPLARACLPVMVIFALLWGSLPMISKSPASSRRTPVPAMTAAAEDDTTPSGTASVSTSIINIAKNIVGSGVLALSFGIASFTAAPAGVWPALAILFSLGGLSAYTFAIIARIGDEVGANSYQDIWAKVFGKISAILPALTVIFKTAVGGLSYAIILGDSFASIASLAGLPAALCKANTWILGLTGLVLLPLSLLRNLSALAIGSVIGTAGTIYTALFMFLRSLDGSYAVGGKFHALIPASSQPFFAAASASSPLLNSSIFVLVSMVATTFLAHYNAPKFYQELAKPEDGSSKVGAFSKVVAGAFGLAAILCAVIMASGFLTFGGAAQGLILNSYATTDTLAFLARLGICTSIIFSYPIIFVGLRESVLNTLKLDGSKASTHVISTLALICAVNGLSLVVKNLGLVVAVGGAVLGSALVYVFPAMMFIKATLLKKKSLEAAGEKLPAARIREMYANYGVAGLGCILGVIGVKMSLKSAGL